MVCWLKSKECMSHIVIHFSTVVHTVNWDAIDKVEQRVSTDPFMVPSSDSWSACTATDRIALWALAACRQVWWYTWNLGCTFKGGQFQTPVLAIELAMGSNYNIPFSIIRGHHFFFKELQLGQRTNFESGDPCSFHFLIQRAAVAIQRGNTAAVLGTLPVWLYLSFLPIIVLYVYFPNHLKHRIFHLASLHGWFWFWIVFPWLCSPPGVTGVAVSTLDVIWSWVQTGYYREVCSHWVDI